jgi:ribosomal protein S18 acetylase RimI-like enzyme
VLNGLQFSEFDSSDTEGVVRVFRSRVPDFFAAEEEADLRGYLKALEEKESFEERMLAWTMRLGEEIVGFGGVEVLHECGYLCWGQVAARVGGKRLGSELLRYRIEAIRKLGAKSVMVDTTPEAEGFYVKNGLITYKRMPSYWSETLDLAAMEKSLDGVARGPMRREEEGKLLMYGTPS